MECMILSAIFLTLTAARLKKGNNDNPHSKLLLSKEYERKRYASQVNATNKKYKTNSNHNHHNNNAAYYQQQQRHNHQHHQTDDEYHQKFEHLKIVEIEKKNEEKRLKKQKKREERLKRKEEELKKQKDIEEKRRRYQNRENTSCKNTTNHNNSYYHQTVTNNFEKYCCVDNRSNSSNQTTQYRKKSRKLSLDDQQSSNKYFTASYYNTRQNIPRFNNTATKRNYYSSQQPRSTSEALSISCSSNSLSASCSSLSSISSSGSCSPPPPMSPKSDTQTPAWNKPCRFSDSNSTKSLSPRKSESIGKARPELNRSWSLNAGNIAEESNSLGTGLLPNKSHVLKSYANGRAVRNKISTCSFDSSSLFCSTQEDQEKPLTSGEMSNGNEYSLFGSHQFGSTFLKSPII